MKKKLSLLLLFISLTSLAQVTDIITDQFLGSTEAVIDGDNMYILLLGPLIFLQQPLLFKMFLHTLML